MHLAILTHKVDRLDGQGRVNYEVARTALEQGHQVTIFAEFCSSDIAQHPRGCFVQARRRHVPTQMLRNLLYAWRCARWLKRHRKEFDVVQANGFVTWVPTDIVAVHFVHSAWLRNEWYPFHWSSFRPYAIYQRALTTMNSYFERRAFRSADLLIAVSRFTAGEVIRLGIPADKLHVVHNGVDTGEFSPGTSSRREFGLPEKVPLALFVGDIRTARKNLETVLKALQSVRTLHLAVAGAVAKSPYPALAAQLGLSDRVHFLGKTSRIAALMRSCDFFVFPSRYEAHPLVLLEALASGLPVLVSGNFGAADYIQEGGKILSDPNDAIGLARLMTELIEDPGERQRMSEGARREALKMQWSRTAQGYLQVYEELIRRRLARDANDALHPNSSPALVSGSS